MNEELSDIEVDDYENVEPATYTTRDSNSVIRQIRAAQKEAVARARKAEQENELLKKELQEQVMVNAKRDVFALFRDANVSTKFAEDCWAMGNHTVEQAAEWALERGLLREPEAELVEPQSRKPSGFKPATGGSTGGLGGIKVSMEEYRRAAALDPARAEQLWKNGMVEGADAFIVEENGAVVSRGVPY